MPKRQALSTAAIGLSALALAVVSSAAVPEWTVEERTVITSLSLAELGPVPPDPSNRVADDPRAADLGRAMFFDTRFSADGSVSCASCHKSDRQYQDDLPLGRGIGVTARRKMPIAGMAYSPFLFWDGRKDSLWSQALGPMQSAVEHGDDRTHYAHLVAEAYRGPDEALFGALPDLDHLPRRAGPVTDPASAAAWDAMSGQDQRSVSQVFANIGKSIAAFERTIRPDPTRFDAYAAALANGSDNRLLTQDEISGLRLFIGKGECVNCHNGPLLSDGHFHNTGVVAAQGVPPDIGRAAGAATVAEDPFNCLGAFSDAGPDDCEELRFISVGGPDEPGAFKTPSLRGVSTRPPYMHAGQIATLETVVQHYRAAPAAPVGNSELRPLELSDEEVGQLVAFLATLEPQKHRPGN